MDKETIDFIIELFTEFLLGIGIAMKAIWNSALLVAGLFAYSLIILALMKYYEIDISSINNFMHLIDYLMTNWIYFFTAFFLLYIYDNRWRLK